MKWNTTPAYYKKASSSNKTVARLLKGCVALIKLPTPVPAGNIACYIRLSGLTYFFQSSIRSFCFRWCVFVCAAARRCVATPYLHGGYVLGILVCVHVPLMYNHWYASRLVNGSFFPWRFEEWPERLDLFFFNSNILIAHPHQYLKELKRLHGGINQLFLLVRDERLKAAIVSGSPFDYAQTNVSGNTLSQGWRKLCPRELFNIKLKLSTH